MRKMAKDDPNSQFAASVFEFIFFPLAPPSSTSCRQISLDFQSTLCSDFRGINVGLLAHPWTPLEKVFF